MPHAASRWPWRRARDRRRARRTRRRPAVGDVDRRSGGRDRVAELKADPAVEYAEPNYVVSLATEGSIAASRSTIRRPAGQYSLDRMRVRDAWSITRGGSNVVAVLDTGVQANHPDLSGRVLPGYNFVSTNTNASDDNGHGTWVAGIIAANANNGVRYRRHQLDRQDPAGQDHELERHRQHLEPDLGIVWAANNGAHVINMSVGGFPYSKAVEDAVNYAWNKGAVLVGAAGNNGRQEDFYPASYANVISVSATQGMTSSATGRATGRRSRSVPRAPRS
jgi:thermitase